MAVKPPLRHNFDKYAHDIARHVEDGDPLELLDPHYVAAKLHVTTQWLNLAYSGGYGPPAVDLSPRIRRYPRGELVKYLRMRGNVYAQQMAGKKKNKVTQTVKPAPKQTQKRMKPTLEAAE